jgi:long-chain acyl-CoA synthetase
MEAGTTPARGTGSATIADLCAAAAAQYADHVAIKHKVDGAWRDVTYAQLGAIVTELGLGLIALGLQPGERVSILCNTRPEWTYADFAISAAGGVVVPIYPTNSPEECEWVAGNSESVFVVCEDAEQVAKIVAVRGNLPNLREIVVIDGPVEGTITLDELRERGRGRDRSELEARYEAVTPEDAFTFIYTSGTTGPPKGCVLSHGNYRSVLNMVEERELFQSGDDLAYLFLPLAHAFALLIQLAVFDRGAAIAYFGGDAKQIIPELMEVHPTYLPSVPRIFEKLFTLAQSQLSAEEIEQIRSVGGKIQDLIAHGQEVPDDLREQFAPLEPKAEFVRGLFGGRLREAVTGAAPIAHEILEFFWGCGVPVLEGYGMTETSTTATSSSPENHRFGSVGRALPGVEIRIADDGEILIKGANIFQGYYKNDDASFGAVEDGWLHTGDLGSIDDDGFVWIEGRVSDMINRGGLKVFPAQVEEVLVAAPGVRDAAVIGVPDDRLGEVPWAYVVTVDGGADEAALDAWCRERLSPYKVPVRVVAVDVLPRNEIGKVLRRELVEQAGR